MEAGRKKRAVGGKKTTPSCNSPKRSSPIAEHRYPDRFLNGPLLHEDPCVPCSKLCQVCRESCPSFPTLSLSLSTVPKRKKREKIKGRRRIYTLPSRISMQTSDVRKFEKIGPEKGTTMFLVKVTKYQIASSSTREVRERKKKIGRKEEREVSADFRLGNGTDEEPSILMNRAASTDRKRRERLKGE